jgi:hypothetical protein
MFLRTVVYAPAYNPSFGESAALAPQGLSPLHELAFRLREQPGAAHAAERQKGPL